MRAMTAMQHQEVASYTMLAGQLHSRHPSLDGLGSEVNAMNPAYAKKLGLLLRKTYVGAQKID